jgi:hypothetical protein
MFKGYEVNYRISATFLLNVISPVLTPDHIRTVDCKGLYRNRGMVKRWQDESGNLLIKFLLYFTGTGGRSRAGRISQGIS